MICFSFILIAILAELSLSKTALTSREIKNLEIAQNFLLALGVNHDADKIRQYSNVDLIQHNSKVPNGVEPMISGLIPAFKNNNTNVQIVRRIVESNYVAFHNIWNNAYAFGSPKLVTFDVYRVDEKTNRVAEHWDSIGPFVNVTESGRTQTDGPTEPDANDLPKTEENKKIVNSLLEDVLMGKNPSKVDDYISNTTYYQHNPNVKDGLESIKAVTAALVAKNEMFVYTKIHKLIGQGNFVLSISEGQWMGKTYSFYDLWRVQDKKIVEHWDVIQEVPTVSTANNNGMFGGFEIIYTGATQISVTFLLMFLIVFFI